MQRRFAYAQVPTASSVLVSSFCSSVSFFIVVSWLNHNAAFVFVCAMQYGLWRIHYRVMMIINALEIRQNRMSQTHGLHKHFEHFKHFKRSTALTYENSKNSTVLNSPL